MFHQRVKRMSHIVSILVALSAAAAWAQPYDVAWTFGSVDSSSYRLDAVVPDDIGFPPLGSEDPTLPLELGKCYQITVTDPALHPFEVIAKGSSPEQDKVLLSMTIQGPFESDPGVDWKDNGQGTVSFTLTTPLYQAMVEGGRVPGYRCALHPFEMRGDFTVAGLPIAERIAPSPIAIDLDVVASGLTAPVALVPDPVETNRLYIVDQAGLARVIDHGQLLEEPFLDVRNLLVQPLGFLGSFDVNDFDERGFLGLAFHPGYADPTSPGHGRFYTYTSEPVQGPADFTVELPPDTTMNCQSVIREWQLDPGSGRANPNSSRVLMRVDKPQFNHNAGHITFGPDGYLYIAFGDGGGANDTSPGHGTTGNGQNINVILGKLVRIDPLAPALTPNSLDPASANGAYRVPVDNPFVGVDGLDEIYAYGFRNPYRFSFDTHSSILIVADVGQNLVEEIDIVRKGGNYGWNLKEGTFKFDPEGVELGLPLDDPALTDPVAQYDHDDGISVIGGYTYYGSEVPDLWGRYVCGDFSRGFRPPEGRLLVADLFTGQIQELLIGAARSPLGLYVKGVGQDHEGEVYVLASTALGPYGDTGVVLKVVPARTKFVAVLSGATAGTDSPATGHAVFELNPDGSAISYRLKVQGIENVTVAHIHVADAPGGSGPPAVGLYPAVPPATVPAGQFSGLLAEGQITDASLVGPLAGKTLADLLRAIQENRAYVNVHTEEFPAGVIQGRVVALPAQTRFAAELSAAAAGTDSLATGQTVLELNADGDSLSYRLDVQKIENVTVAHIHVADEPGGIGPPAVWLYPSAPPEVLIPGEFTGRLAEGEITAANLIGPLAGKALVDLLTAIEENRAYVNVHTEKFPAGAIQGALEAVHAQPPISAALSGPGAGTNSEAVGQAVLRPSADGQAISYQLEVLGIRNVTMAHIHIASASGGEGSPAVWLYPSAPPAALIPGESRGVLGEGSFAAANFVGPLAGKTLDDLIVAIQEDRAYVNVHTQQFPGGEIRGRLR